MRERRTDKLHGDLTVFSDSNFGACLSQKKRDQTLIIQTVLDQQDAAIETRGRTCAGLACRDRFDNRVAGNAGHANAVERFRLHGQCEGAPLPRSTDDGNGPSQHLSKPLADRQPEAGSSKFAGVGVICLTERAEEPVKFRGSDSDTGVNDVDPQPCLVSLLSSAGCKTRRIPPASVNLTAFPTRLMRICRRRMGSVTMVSGSPPRDSTDRVSPLASARTRINDATSANQLARRTGDALDFELSRLDLGKIENVGEDIQQMVAVAFDRLDRLDVFGSGCIAEIVEKDIGKSEDRGHRRANLVAHIGEEFALGAVGGLGGLFGAHKLRLDTLAALDLVPEFLRSLNDPLLQLFVGLFDRRIRFFHATQHAVELVTEYAQLVGRIVRDADRVVSVG